MEDRLCAGHHVQLNITASEAAHLVAHTALCRARRQLQHRGLDLAAGVHAGTTGSHYEAVCDGHQRGLHAQAVALLVVPCKGALARGRA